jgi:hypothetical protein
VEPRRFRSYMLGNSGNDREPSRRLPSTAPAIATYLRRGRQTAHYTSKSAPYCSRARLPVASRNWCEATANRRGLNFSFCRLGPFLHKYRVSRLLVVVFLVGSGGRTLSVVAVPVAYVDVHARRLRDFQPTVPKKVSLVGTF